MKTRHIIGTAVAGIALVLAGCSRSDIVSPANENGGMVRFRIGGLQLKGTLINSEDEMLEAGVKSFRVQAWNADYSSFVASQQVSYDEASEEWELATPQSWTGTDTKTFFAYTNLPESGATVVDTFTNEAQKQTLTYTLPLDARQQNDIMLGCYSGTGDGALTASINFVHPLSSIVLRKGEMDVEAITKVVISGICASGTVNVTYAANGTPSYNWGETRTGAVVSTLLPEAGSTEIEIDSEDGTIGTPFIVIPQTVAANQVKITVTATVEGEEKNLAIKIPAGELVAGETKVFTLGYYDPTQTHFIDLGLPSGTLWANMNVGATSETEAGWFFSWGNVDGKVWTGSQWVEASDNTKSFSGFSLTNYNGTPGKSLTANIPVDTEHDAALLYYGDNCRMPTKDDFQELRDYADWNWDSGKKGYIISSKTNPENKIFLYAAGCGNNDGSYGSLGSVGHYWANTYYSTTHSYDLRIASGEIKLSHDYERNHGFSIRAVKAKPIEFAVTGAVERNHLNTKGESAYQVTSLKSWKLQYTLNGTDWTDAVASTKIDDWISFDKVSGTGTGSAETVTATVDAATSTTVTTDHNANLRGATAKGTEASPFDLSTHDIYGNLNAGGKVTTANCYVVSAPGWYSFPLVYGNAVKNGAVNTAAFAPTAAASSSTYLTPFVKADGYGITTPYIAGAASASVLWEDVANYAIISNTAADCKLVGSGTGTKVVFHVNQATLTPGNVVIAVKDASSKILWSWHIWVTDEDLSCLTVTNYDGTFNKGVMPVNLGWVDLDLSKEGYEGKSLQIRFVEMDGDAISKTVLKTAKRVQYITSSEKGQSPTYQWGRKDPFIRAANIKDVSELTKDERCGAYIEKKSEELTFADIIKNPTWFMFNNGNYNKNVGKYYNLWSANSTAYGNTANGYKEAPVKTVYDPCPPGFQVAQANAFTGFTTDGDNHEKEPAKYNVVDNFNYGWTFYTKPNKEGTTIHFPVQGYRAFNSGNITAVTTNGYYWSAIQCATDRSYALYTVKNSSTNCVKPINTENSYRSNGFPIRPVQE